MKYQKCRLLCGLVIATLVFAPVAGCSKSTDTDSETVESVEENKGENSFVYTDDTEAELADTSIMGIVESVDGNEITLKIGGGFGGGASDGEMPSGGAPDGEAPSGDVANGEAPDGEAPSGDASNGEAPSGEMPSGGAPDGEAPSGDASNGEAPSGEMSGDGNQASGSAPEGMTAEMATGVLTIGDESVISVAGTDGTTSEGSLEDITEGTMLQISFDENGAITSIEISTGMNNMAQGGMPGGNGAADISYSAVNEYTEDTSIESETITSTGTDENAVLVSDGNVNLSDVIVERTSTDSTGGDNSSFYGVGAAILTTNGTTSISDAKITTDAAGGAGVFSYGTGVTYIADSVISTAENTSGGIHVAGGGTLYAWDLQVETDGESAAAIRSDRGGGTMVVDGGTYTSNGVGSPALYCTADIAVHNAELVATGSEAICMEGLNTIHLYDCDITGNMSDLEQNDTTWTIIVYQSMSGDSEVGNSTMQIVGGSLTSENGGLFYTTNTECNILFSDVDITYADDSEFFLMCTGNNNQRGWGTTGANGSQCTFTAKEQEMQGDVVWDSISTLDFYMMDGSSLTGAVVDDETYAGNGGTGYCNLYISKDSVWTVTGDSQVTSLQCEGSIVDADGNEVSVIGSDGTVYREGTSEYTVTVESYSDTADFSNAATEAEWSSYEISKPETL